MSRSFKASAAVAALALLLAGCANDSSDGGATSDGGGGGGSAKVLPAQSSIETPAGAVKAAGDGKGKCAAGTTIAYVGAMTGDNAQLGINIYNGVQQAINEHNKANPGCQVKFSKVDTEGSPDKATGPVTQVTNTKNVVGVIGLPFSGESKATGKIFEQAGLVHITPSATNPDLTKNGWTTFFRALGNDNVQGPAVPKLAEKIGAKKVFVVQDDSDYGIGLAKTATAALGDKVAGSDKVVTKQKDFSATIQKILNSKADAVFYAGYFAEGAPLDQQLVGKGFKGTFIGPDGVKDDQFIKLAGSSSKNAYFTCPCIPGELIKEFATGYKAVSGGKDPGTYSVEGYDAATVLLSGIDKGKATRPALKDYVKTYDGQGLSKKFKWDDKGELAELAVYGYRVDNGKIVSVGTIG
ncbi:branched-chain amino acid ABC transporter substrate-binding protein [Luteipulveratus sp. YIM 133132]|uniref:branched-chain amino acid ABC transporter substrate-binding protein n=1 Tax=Luteipulveratus flavus TaxID=3031728 RepID=UPI0023AF247E|nr:branched-chain amino acid ABC transporter substrate-binding protein [Luteipulveratus sp. YIM 133132]MDE9366003.1 branched-chain amino acid ABC transporter substrate-binding protein [Luteipulveratus sp. YIM 133132]